MKFINEDFSYYLSPDKNTEALIGLKQYFEEYIEMQKLNKTDNIPNSSKFITSNIIGTIMFELIQMNNMEYDKITAKNIEYFKFYLNNCINNAEFCNNKIFLSCMQECLSLSLPRSELHIENIYTPEQRCNYNLINANYRNKTDIIFDNRNDIKYSKVYYCNCIEDLFISSIYELFEKGYFIKKCKNCKKFFVTKEKGSRIKYCYNISPDDNTKTCYVYKSQENSKNNRKTNPRINLYNKITERIRIRLEREENQKVCELYREKLTHIKKELKMVQRLNKI